VNRALRIGLKILGAGFASAIGSIFSGPWGPSGPSNSVGLIFMFWTILLLPVGTLISLAGLLVSVGRWSRAGSIPKEAIRKTATTG
jgi:hypothetical protein